MAVIGEPRLFHRLHRGDRVINLGKLCIREEAVRTAGRRGARQEIRADRMTRVCEAQDPCIGMFEPSAIATNTN